MPFYRYTPNEDELDGVESPLPAVVPVNYHDEQVSWAYLQENGYFFLLEGDFRYMMDRQQVNPRIVTDETDESGKCRIVSVELVPARYDI